MLHSLISVIYYIFTEWVGGLVLAVNSLSFQWCVQGRRHEERHCMGRDPPADVQVGVCIPQLQVLPGESEWVQVLDAQFPWLLFLGK